MTVELDGDRLRVSPADRITTDFPQFACDRRAELLTKLSAANDAQSTTELPPATKASAPELTPAPAVESISEATNEPCCNAWTIIREGKPICTVCGEPEIRPRNRGESKSTLRYLIVSPRDDVAEAGTILENLIG